MLDNIQCVVKNLALWDSWHEEVSFPKLEFGKENKCTYFTQSTVSWIENLNSFFDSNHPELLNFNSYCGILY